MWLFFEGGCYSECGFYAHQTFMYSKLVNLLSHMSINLSRLNDDRDQEDPSSLSLCIKCSAKYAWGVLSQEVKVHCVSVS